MAMRQFRRIPADKILKLAPSVNALLKSNEMKQGKVDLVQCVGDRLGVYGLQHFNKKEGDHPGRCRGCGPDTQATIP